MRFRLVLVSAFLAGAPLIALAQSGPSTAIKGFLVDKDGNLGVGTSAPTAMLHVAGDSLVAGTIKGGGLNGQIGSAAVLNGFDSRYGARQFAFRYDDSGDPQKSIRIQAVNPTNPSQSVFKTFVIQHPKVPAKYLIHAAIEGPEGAVYYRGSARLSRGRAVVRLPDYFEALVRAEGRTVQLTNVDGFDRLAVSSRGGRTIVDGAFVVVADRRDSDQRFDWEVKAVRADGPPLEVEADKRSVAVGGFGPYTFPAPMAPAGRP